MLTADRLSAAPRPDKASQTHANRHAFACPGGSSAAHPGWVECKGMRARAQSHGPGWRLAIVAAVAAAAVFFALVRAAAGETAAAAGAIEVRGNKRIE